MAEFIFRHTSEWIEKLTCPMQELSPFEREAIAKHIATCPDCYHIVADFAALPWLFEALPVTELPPGLPPKLEQLWREEDANKISSPPRKNLFSYLPTAEATQEKRSEHLPSSLDTGTLEPTFERLIEELME